MRRKFCLLLRQETNDLKQNLGRERESLGRKEEDFKKFERLCNHVDWLIRFYRKRKENTETPDAGRMHPSCAWFQMQTDKKWWWMKIINKKTTCLNCIKVCESHHKNNVEQIGAGITSQHTKTNKEKNSECQTFGKNLIFSKFEHI